MVMVIRLKLISAECGHRFWIVAKQVTISKNVIVSLIRQIKSNVAFLKLRSYCLLFLVTEFFISTSGCRNSFNQCFRLAYFFLQVFFCGVGLKNNFLILFVLITSLVILSFESLILKLFLELESKDSSVDFYRLATIFLSDLY